MVLPKIMSTKANLPYYLYRFSNFCYQRHIHLLPFLTRQFMRVVFSAIIPYEAKIGKNVHFGYNGLGIVIHRNCVIGDNVHFFQQLTPVGRGNGVSGSRSQVGRTGTLLFYCIPFLMQDAV